MGTSLILIKLCVKNLLSRVRVVLLEGGDRISIISGGLMCHLAMHLTRISVIPS